MSCENNLFVQCANMEIKDHFMNLLSDGIKLFETFVPLTGSKLECYGVDSDVYIEYIFIEMVSEKVINLKFFTHNFPCIEFCKRLSARFSVNIQLVYLNETNNYSGQFRIFSNQIVKNDLFSYWQGMYIYKNDDFWEKLPETFEKYQNFMELISNLNISIPENELNILKTQFDEQLLFKQFERL